MGFRLVKRPGPLTQRAQRYLVDDSTMWTSVGRRAAKSGQKVRRAQGCIIEDSTMWTKVGRSVARSASEGALTYRS